MSSLLVSIDYPKIAINIGAFSFHCKSKRSVVNYLFNFWQVQCFILRFLPFLDMISLELYLSIYDKHNKLLKRSLQL
jgi:hypothetical protein